jgi:hypothetical protein
MKYLILIIRIILTILLLVEVFLHSHWSIGVCLTLITISIEAISFNLLNINKLLKFL